MAIINGVEIPKIQSEYWLGTQSRSSFKKEEFKTRAEKYAEAEANFAKVYFREYEEKISKEIEGIVVIQLGRYPNSFDVTINPLSDAYCLRQALDMKKVIHVPYVFESRTYWLSKGRVKLLLKGEDAVDMMRSQEAMNKVCKTANYVGEYIIKQAHGRSYPYRLWENEGKFWLMSLLNGAVASVETLPEIVEMPDVFYVGEIRLVRCGNGNFVLS